MLNCRLPPPKHTGTDTHARPHSPLACPCRMWPAAVWWSTCLPRGGPRCGWRLELRTPAVHSRCVLETTSASRWQPTCRCEGRWERGIPGHAPHPPPQGMAWPRSEGGSAQLSSAVSCETSRGSDPTKQLGRADHQAPPASLAVWRPSAIVRPSRRPSTCGPILIGSILCSCIYIWLGGGPVVSSCKSELWSTKRRHPSSYN